MRTQGEISQCLPIGELPSGKGPCVFITCHTRPKASHISQPQSQGGHNPTFKSLMSSNLPTMGLWLPGDPGPINFSSENLFVFGSLHSVSLGWWVRLVVRTPGGGWGVGGHLLHWGHWVCHLKLRKDVFSLASKTLTTSERKKNQSQVDETRIYKLKGILSEWRVLFPYLCVSTSKMLKMARELVFLGRPLRKEFPLRRDSLW